MRVQCLYLITHETLKTGIFHKGDKMKKIPFGSIEIQKGLWLFEQNKNIASKIYKTRELYSSDGYCFWQVSNTGNYDEEENLKPESERVYAQYAGLGSGMGAWTYEQLNAEFISVPIQEGFEIV